MAYNKKDTTVKKEETEKMKWNIMQLLIFSFVSASLFTMFTSKFSHLYYIPLWMLGYGILQKWRMRHLVMVSMVIICSLHVFLVMLGFYVSPLKLIVGLAIASVVIIYVELTHKQYAPYTIKNLSPKKETGRKAKYHARLYLLPLYISFTFGLIILVYMQLLTDWGNDAYIFFTVALLFVYTQFFAIHVSFLWYLIPLPLFALLVNFVIMMTSNNSWGSVTEPRSLYTIFVNPVVYYPLALLFGLFWATFYGKDRGELEYGVRYKGRFPCKPSEIKTLAGSWNGGSGGSASVGSSYGGGFGYSSSEKYRDENDILSDFSTMSSIEQREVLQEYPHLRDHHLIKHHMNDDVKE